jgi:hypothetical protein
MSPLHRIAALAAAVLTVSPSTARPEGAIQDNSFLIEEAYNQEPGVIQHVSSFTRSSRTGAWVYSFTEEWPVRGQTHQASVTLCYADLRGPGARGMGDLALNYRWQAMGNGEAPVALAPRLSLLLPTGDASKGLGAGGAGVQVNLPLSAVLSHRFVSHVNLGGTYLPSARAGSGASGPLTTLAFGQSLVWLAHRRLNFLVEGLYTVTELSFRAAGERAETLTVNPGVRAAIDFASGLQIVPGFGVPMGLGPSRGQNAVLFYLGLEHPFAAAGPQSS